MACARFVLVSLVLTTAAAQLATEPFVQNAVNSIMQMLTAGQTGTSGMATFNTQQPIASPESFGPAQAPTQTQTGQNSALMDINNFLQSAGLISGGPQDSFATQGGFGMTSTNTMAPQTLTSSASAPTSGTGTNSVTSTSSAGSTGNTIMDRVAAIMQNMPNDPTSGGLTSSFGSSPSLGSTSTSATGTVMTLSNGMQMPFDPNLMSFNMGQLPANLAATLPAGLGGLTGPTLGGTGGMDLTGGGSIPPMDGSGGLTGPTLDTMAAAGMGGMPPILPMDASALMSSPLMGPLQNQAILNVGRRISQRTGVHEYYQVHGCEDPTQIFSGQERTMAHYAMAQGCQSVMAEQVCKLAQFRRRVGASVVTSQVLPMNMMTQLESCLSPKVLLNGMNNPIMMGMGPLSMGPGGTPSINQCWMLLSTVMDGGSIDPESMIHTRRSLLPWSCQETNMGMSVIPYRVCCPGKVADPTLSDAVMVQRMVNA